MFNYFDGMSRETGYMSIHPELYDTIEFMRLIGKEDEFYKELYNLWCNVEHYKEWTEVVLMLNWKSWEYAGRELDDEIVMHFGKLYEIADDAGYKAFEGNEEATHYFWSTLD